MLRRSRWWWTCAPSVPSADGPVRVTMREVGELEIGRVDVELLQNPFDSSRVEILLKRRDPCSHSNAVMRALALLLVERPRKIALRAYRRSAWISWSRLISPLCLPSHL